MILSVFVSSPASEQGIDRSGLGNDLTVASLSHQRVVHFHSLLVSLAIVTGPGVLITQQKLGNLNRAAGLLASCSPSLSEKNSTRIGDSAIDQKKFQTIGTFFFIYFAFYSFSLKVQLVQKISCVGEICVFCILEKPLDSALTSRLIARPSPVLTSDL